MYTEKDIQRVREAEINGYSHCYALVYKNRITVETGRACYSGLWNFVGIEDDPVILFVDRTYRGYKPKKTIPQWDMEYFHWLANGSPWADSFVNKDAEDIIETGAILKTDMPMAFVMQAAFACRAAAEFSDIIPTWAEIKKHTDPLLALLIAHYYYLKDGKLINGACGNSNHYMFNSCSGNNGPEAIRNLLNNNREAFKDKPPMYLNSEIWTPIWSLWGDNGGRLECPDAVEEDFDSWGKKYMKAKPVLLDEIPQLIQQFKELNKL